MVERRVRAGAAIAGVLFIACASERGPTERASTRTVAQDLSATPLFGTSLGAKQLALSFDDGPGSRTLELSAYLKGRGIAATFFVNSQCFDAGNGCGNNNPTRSAATVLAQLVADGHIVANHTRDHKDLVNDFPLTPAGDAAIIAELSDVDAVIAPYVPNNRFMFRAPFGSFYQTNRAYTVLQGSAMKKYVGHIEWDIGGTRTATTAADWACWQNNPKLTSKACGDLYIQEINNVGKGIVLMHDADYGNVGNTDPLTGVGNTIDMVKTMVPLLEAAGYTFKRVDEVPAIAALFPPPPCDASCATCSGPAANQCTSCAGGRYLSAGQCLACATCAANQYVSSACTPTANTVCAACDATCATCTGATANDCTSCGANRWLNGTACPTCSACGAGTYESAACTTTSDTACSPCDASCSACSGPAPSDCGTCLSGYFLSGGACKACTKCAAGTYRSSACTTTADAKCTPCEAGTFSAANATTCAACPAGTFSAGGAATCTACGACDDGDACTDDRCDAAKGCVHTPIPGCGPKPPVDAGADASKPGPIDDGSADSGPAPEAGGAEDGCSVARRPAHGREPAALIFGALALSAFVRSLRPRGGRTRSRPGGP